MDHAERRRRIRQWLAARPRRAEPAHVRRKAELRPPLPADLDSLTFRRRWLPHWELAGSTYFVTFRVRRDRGRPFRSQDAWSNPPGPGAVVEETLFVGYGQRAEIDAYVVMPDHVHLLITPLPDKPLSKILQGIKGYSAWRLNGLSDRRGPFWQDESFDHLIRSEADWLDKHRYILHNPVAAGLVRRAEDYPLSSAVTLDPPGRREELLRLLEE